MDDVRHGTYLLTSSIEQIGSVSNEINGSLREHLVNLSGEGILQSVKIENKSCILLFSWNSRNLKLTATRPLCR